jgi:hypothetical protein
MSEGRLWRVSMLACLPVALLVSVYAKPVAILVYMKWNVRNDTKLWVVPTPVHLVDAPHAAGKTMSYFGYEFESPWTEVKQEKKFESSAILYFAGGQVISILDPAHDVDELQMLKQEAGKRGVDLKSVLGDEATRSKYALLSKIWSLTPADLRFFSSRQEMVTNSLFLMLKKIWITSIKGGLYSFETGRLRGLQEGDPGEDNMVIIEAFDTSDNRIEIYVGSQRGANARPSQEDINRILCSLRPATATPTK